MELFFELIFEIIVEGTLEIGTSRKVPLVIRILAFLVFLAIFGGITVLLFLCGIRALQEGRRAAGILFLVVALGLAIGSVYMILKRARSR